jgi:hypothetical protein
MYTTAMSNLEQEFEYYLENQKELVEKYSGKYLLIKDKQVVGAYESEMEAYQDAISKYEAGSFLIQPCLPGEESYTQTFHSRAMF